MFQVLNNIRTSIGVVGPYFSVIYVKIIHFINSIKAVHLCLSLQYLSGNHIAFPLQL